jgi:hypothetical protein
VSTKATVTGAMGFGSKSSNPRQPAFPFAILLQFAALSSAWGDALTSRAGICNFPSPKNRFHNTLKATIDAAASADAPLRTSCSEAGLGSLANDVP